MRNLGRIVQLQVQLDVLKPGEGDQRVFDPTPLRSVPRLWISPEGTLAEGPDGGYLLDVHHAAHPRSRQREGVNALSFGSSFHWAEMMAHFGRDLPLGIAGENFLVDSDLREVFKAGATNAFILSAHTGRRFPLTQIRAAQPCAPFAAYLLGELHPDPPRLKNALQFLSHGTRGYYARWPGEGALIQVGDELFSE